MLAASCMQLGACCQVLASSSQVLVQLLCRLSPRLPVCVCVPKGALSERGACKRCFGAGWQNSSAVGGCSLAHFPCGMVQ
jgi:hypothetical protein